MLTACSPSSGAGSLRMGPRPVWVTGGSPLGTRVVAQVKSATPAMGHLAWAARSPPPRADALPGPTQARSRPEHAINTNLCVATGTCECNAQFTAQIDMADHVSSGGAVTMGFTSARGSNPRIEVIADHGICQRPDGSRIAPWIRPAAHQSRTLRAEEPGMYLTASSGVTHGALAYMSCSLTLAVCRRRS